MVQAGSKNKKREQNTVKRETKVLFRWLGEVHAQFPRAQKKKNGEVQKKHPPKVGPLGSVAHL
jgi:hypothetical protein